MSSLQVILLRDIPHLGKLGDIVKCKRGYVRNHLLPNKLVEPFTPAAKERFEKMKAQLIKEQKDSRTALEDLHGKLDGYIVQEKVEAQPNGAMYGSITAVSIVDILHKQDITLKRNQIELPGGDAIKEIGDYDIKVTLAHDLVATLKFSVVTSS